MAPSTKQRTLRDRKPLAVAATPCDQTQLPSTLVEIFNSSQHVTSADSALSQMKKLYKQMEFRSFDQSFRGCVKKLFQSKRSIFFKTSCEFLCKFLQHLAKLSDEVKAKELENTAPATAKSKRDSRLSLTTASTAHNANKKSRQAAGKRGVKRKADTSDDELIMGFLSTTDAAVDENDSADEVFPIDSATHRRKSLASVLSSPKSTCITNHDRIISSCIDVADLYMQVSDEECRSNAVFFICKFLSHSDSLDETICDALKSTLPKRIRDRKPLIRAQAVLSSRTFQDSKMIQEGFLHHFYRDPELVVRKALLQVMDTQIFGYDFLVDSTQDSHEAMRKAAYQRLGKISPSELNLKQLHRVIHNGLNERERQASYSFRTHTLDIWLKTLYDGNDLCKLLDHFDVIDTYDDVCRLLETIYERDLDRLENNNTSTKLHHVVEFFRERYLSSDNTCLINMNDVNERVIVIWLTLIKFCRKNQILIKPVKIRIQRLASDPNESIEGMLESQDRADEVVELHERLTPDLVNIASFIKRFIDHADKLIRKEESLSNKLEFIYSLIMHFIATYEIGDELERKTVQEVFEVILRENLLTGKFNNFITPLIICLHKIIYSSSSNLMINFVSELINNVRSHLEDLIASTQPHNQLISVSLCPSTIAKKVPPKKIRIEVKPQRNSVIPDIDNKNLEFKIATIRVDLEELKDELEKCVKAKDFDQAKVISNKIDNLQAEYALLHSRRCSIASDVSHMSMVVESETTDDDKFSSTRIGDSSLNESNISQMNREDLKIFKHHPNELVKCLHMYLGCLQSVKISKVPPTMLNNLTHLSYECLDECFKNDSRIRSLMVACNGVTALVDKEFATETTTMTLLVAACFDPDHIEVRTVGFTSLVDVLCQQEQLNCPMDKVERFLNSHLREYGKYDANMAKKESDFASALIEGTAKLLYFKKISSDRILSHIILWWYHPSTPSKLKQFIGVFLPTFVHDAQRKSDSDDELWIQDLLQDTFVTSIELLHDYILGRGFNIMASSDMLSLISFLCNLIPVAFHSKILGRIDERIDELNNGSHDLLKYLKLSKNNLNSQFLAHPVKD